MKLFIFKPYDEEDDTVLIQAESENQARRLYEDRAYATYCEWAEESPLNPRDPYHVPKLAFDKFLSTDNAYCFNKTLEDYELTHTFEVLPNKNPVII